MKFVFGERDTDFFSAFYEDSFNRYLEWLVL